jgi:hypothetical protein
MTKRVRVARKTSRRGQSSNRSANELLRTLDDIKLNVNDMKFNMRLMAVHQEAMFRTIQRWVDHLAQQETRRAREPAGEAQRQGSPDASCEPERSCAIAGPSTPVSSSGSIM